MPLSVEQCHYILKRAKIKTAAARNLYRNNLFLGAIKKASEALGIIEIIFLFKDESAPTIYFEMEADRASDIINSSERRLEI